MVIPRSRIRSARLSAILPLAIIAGIIGVVGWYYLKSDAKRATSTPPLARTSGKGVGSEGPNASGIRIRSPHSLDPALAIAEEYLAAFERDVVDYTAKLTKLERIAGKLGEAQTMSLKFRCPRIDTEGKSIGASVYVGFEEPKSVRGREVIWIEDKNSGKMLAHEGGWLNLASVQLDPAGTLAMMGNKYPITQIGVGKLLRKLIEKGERDRDVGDCEVKIDKNAALDGKPCLQIEVKHPAKKPEFDFHIARIYLDPERKLPLRYEAFLWPEKPGEEPPLEEQYTYRDIKLNVGLNDADFDSKNEAYSFP